MKSGPYDLAVVGGGPAGAVAAAIACRSGLRVVVLEAAFGPRWKPGEVLAPESNPLLQRIGLQVALGARPDVAVRSAGVRSVWGSSEVYFRDGFREPLGAGWVVDRVAFETMLSERAVAAGADWIWRARASSAARIRGVWRVEFSAPETRQVHARVLIDATGRPAALARRLGARLIPYESQIASVIGWPEKEGSGDTWLSVESAPNGWWYTAAAPSRMRVLAWSRGVSATQATAGAIACAMTEAFTATRYLPSIVGDLPWQRTLHAVFVNAGSAALDNCAGDGWLAIGDAAAAFNPIASQGLPSAMASASAASHAALAWLDGQRDALEAYDAQMKETYDFYLEKLPVHFRSEQRWQDRPFWQR